MTSLRRRLGRVMLVLLGGLALQWFLADRMIVHVGENEMATRLDHDSDSLASALSVDEAGELGVDPRLAGVMYGRPYSGHYFVIRMQAQRVQSASFGEAPAFEPPRVDGPSLDHLPGPRGQPLLVLTRPVQVDGRRVDLAVGEDLTDMRGQLLEFRLLFVASSIGVLVAAMLLQGREVREALHPIEAIRDAILRLPEGGKPLAGLRAPKEIQPLLDEIDRLMAFVDRRLKQSRNAIGNLSHAVKTPLTALFRLIDDARIAAHPELQGTLRQEAEAIRARIDRELKRARLAGEQRAGARFAPREELPSLVELLERIHADKRLAIEWRAPAGTLAFDREDLLELIGNLGDNACKWARGRVAIALAERDGALDITVADDGPGVAAEQLGTLGARGQRIDESRPGYGLGLAIVRDIVEFAGGRLDFRPSAALGGLEVAAHLPARAGPAL